MSMRSARIVAWALLCLLGAVGSTAWASAGTGAGPATYSPAQLRGDLDLLWRSIREGDPAFDRYRSKAQLERLYARLRGKIREPMTELEFYPVAARLVAAVANGHTRLSLSEPTQEWLSETAPLLPLGVRVVGGRLRVLKDVTPAGVEAGAEVVSINDVPADKLIAGSVEAMSLDGMSPTPRRQSMGGWYFAYDLVRLHGLRSPYRVVLKVGGSRKLVELEGMPGRQLVDLSYPFGKRAARQGSYLDVADGMAIMRIAHWDYPVEGKPGLAEQLEGWFRELDENPVDALVIDIRDNGGGSEELATQVFAHLVARPFRYYECLSLNAADFGFLRHAANGDEVRKELPKYVAPASERCRRYGPLELTALKNVGIQQPRAPHFAGRVYVLTNAFSFSTSAEFASVFQASGRGTIVGQETSGGYLGNTSGLEVAVVLPATRMRLSVPVVDYRLAVPRRAGPPGGVIPDVVTKYTVEDFIAGRDLEIDAVRRIENGHKPPSEADVIG